MTESQQCYLRRWIEAKTGGVFPKIHHGVYEHRERDLEMLNQLYTDYIYVTLVYGFHTMTGVLLSDILITRHTPDLVTQLGRISGNLFDALANRTVAEVQKIPLPRDTH